MKGLYKVGDLVIPISKSIGCGFDIDLQWRSAKNICQPFLYVNSIYTNCYVCGYKQDGIGSYYKETELIPFENSENALFQHLINGNITEKKYKELINK